MPLRRLNPLNIHLCTEHLALERLEQRAHSQPPDHIVRQPAGPVGLEGLVVAVDGGEEGAAEEDGGRAEGEG